jgi:hypothetical protein
MKEYDFLRKMGNRVEKFLAAQSCSPPQNSLYGCQPHVVFVENSQCILLFDDAGIRSDWPEVATASFAFHRLAREYVRQHFKPYDVPFGSLRQERKRAIDICAEAMGAFVKGYRERPGVAKALKKNGADWAAAINFQKLMTILRFRLLPLQDQHRRNEEEHFALIVAYISYLQELELFREAAPLSG